MTVLFLVAWLALSLFCGSQGSSFTSSSSFHRTKRHQKVFLTLHFSATIGMVEFGFYSKNTRKPWKSFGLPKCLMTFGRMLTCK